MRADCPLREIPRLTTMVNVGSVISSYRKHFKASRVGNKCPFAKKLPFHFASKEFVTDGDS